jgi:ferric-dicitrate binding protein FerR (iron transport regulator)
VTDDYDFDTALRRQFDLVRREDQAEAPAFASMIARARATAATIEAPVRAPIAEAPGRRAFARPLLWATPVVIAASLMILLLRRPDPADRADQEFEQLVTQWSRVNQSAPRSPTDRLLSLPGAEYLRSTPTVGIPQTRSPS